MSDAERLADINRRCYEYMFDKHNHKMTSRMLSRNLFLELMAKNQKGHWRRIVPGGWTDRMLMGVPKFGPKIANYLTKPTKEESSAGRIYATALSAVESIRDNFLLAEHHQGNMSAEEFWAEKVSFIAREHGMNTDEIARLQKEASGKPLSKFMRGPARFIPGFGIYARFKANKRNSLLKIADLRRKEHRDEYAPWRRELVVDAVADKNKHRFFEKIRGVNPNILSPHDVVRAHSEETAEQVGKNRNRLIAPVVVTLGSVAAAVAIHYGFSDTPAGKTPTGLPRPKKPIPSPELVNINTNGAPEHAVNDLLKGVGYKFSGDKTSFLSELAARVGGEDALFIDGAGNPVDMYLRSAGDIGYQPWSEEMGIRLSDAAIKALEGIKGVSEIS